MLPFFALIKSRYVACPLWRISFELSNLYASSSSEEGLISLFLSILSFHSSLVNFFAEFITHFFR
jgi:hypothetical protein